MMVETKINKRWTLKLPDYRAARPEWVSWEEKRLNAMRDDITDGTVVIDVGSEEGDMSALYALWGARVYLIEPNLKVWPSARAVFEANGLKPLGTLAGFAGTDNKEFEEYELEAQQHDGWPKAAYGEMVAEHGFNHLAESSGSISQSRIDDLGIKPDLITIDVEGSEWEVLKGSEETLKEHKPILYLSVHPEFMFANHQQYQSGMFGWLHALGYTGEFLDFSHEQHWCFK